MQDRRGSKKMALAVRGICCDGAQPFDSKALKH
jgi:hypothetical protein